MLSFNEQNVQEYYNQPQITSENQKEWTFAQTRMIDDDSFMRTFHSIYRLVWSKQLVFV